MIYGRSVAFDELDDGDLKEGGARIGAAALNAARVVAAERLAAVLPSAGDASTTVEAFMARDPADPLYDLLKGFEQRWALLVVKLLEPVTNPAAAIRDARTRGVTVASIAEALNIAHQTVYARYGDQIILHRK